MKSIGPTLCLKAIPMILIMALTLLFFRLGFWQLARADEKKAMMEHYHEHSRLPPLNMDTIKSLGRKSADYRTHLRGHFINEQHFLLDNRILDSRLGYNVITPFLSEGHIILVDRGWLPALQPKHTLPTIPPARKKNIFGTLYFPSPNTFVLQEDTYSKRFFPRVIQKIDIENLSSLFDSPLLPVVLRQEASEVPPLVRDTPLPHLNPHKNRGYAFQWFAMACALPLLSYIAIRKNRGSGTHDQYGNRS